MDINSVWPQRNSRYRPSSLNNRHKALQSPLPSHTLAGAMHQLHLDTLLSLPLHSGRQMQWAATEVGLSTVCGKHYATTAQMVWQYGRLSLNTDAHFTITQRIEGRVDLGTAVKVCIAVRQCMRSNSTSCLNGAHTASEITEFSRACRTSDQEVVTG